MKKVIFVFCLAFVLLGSPNLVSAEFNLSQGTDWLYDQMDVANWNKPVDEVALSVLALRNFGYDVSNGVDQLNSEQLGDNSWGNAYYTALATLALHKSGENVSEEVRWLLDNRERAMQNGQWLIQLMTEGYGTCGITYNENPFYFVVNNTIIEESPSGLCTGENWIDFETCVKGGLADVTETLSIDCVGLSVTPSLIFKSYDNSYYLVDEVMPLDLENGCFYGGAYSCDCAYTGYASFVLNELAESYATVPYLATTCTGDALGNSFLLSLTNDGKYSTWLRDNQLGGNWENNKYTTAFATYVLRNSAQGGESVTTATDWIELHQLPEGSWDGSIKTTAMVIWGVFSTELSPISSSTTECNNGVIEYDESCENGIPCTGNLVCQNCTCVTPQTCTEINECMSGTDCAEGYDCSFASCTCEPLLLECTSDLQCELGFYCNEITNTCERSESPGCSSDSDCDDGYHCNLQTGNCEVDEESSNWIAWLISIIVILAGLAAGYYYYMKYKKKPMAKTPSFSGGLPTQGQPKKPNYPVARQAISRPTSKKYAPSRKDHKLESELDESIKKAKDLLKGKGR